MAVVGVALRQGSVSVDAGAEADCTLVVENLSPSVQRFGIVVGGPAAPWAVPDPANFSLLPGQIREAIVRLRPPREAVVGAGTVAVEVTVTPKDAPAESVSTRLDVTVKPFLAITATIDPAVSKGFRKARHVLRVHNGGNVAVAVDVTAADPDRLLEVDVQPATLDLDPGSTGKARIGLRVIPGWPVGEDRSRPFRATVRAAGQPPLTVRAAMHLRTVALPALVPTAGALAVLAVVAALLFARDGTSPGGSIVAGGTTGTTAVPGTTAPAETDTSVATTATNATTSPTRTVPASGGPAAAIALGAECRPTADLQVNGRELSNADGSFLRRFGDDSTALAARDLLVRKPTFCTIGRAGRDEAELTFYPPPVEPTPAVPGSKCTARYVPERLAKANGQDDTFVVEVGPRLNLYFVTEVDRDRAFALLEGYSQICWLGGGREDIFSNFFDWGTAVTYF